MTQEEKELLLKDLSARLPYRVKIDKVLYGATTLNERDIESFRRGFDNILIPYLHPMSSMTEEERKEYELLANRCIVTSIGFIHLEATPLIDWLNAHHFDYHGLIERGLAIEVTEDNNPYED